MVGENSPQNVFWPKCGEYFSKFKNKIGDIFQEKGENCHIKFPF
jgi:hypothetical protein